MKHQQSQHESINDRDGVMIMLAHSCFLPFGLNSQKISELYFFVQVRPGDPQHQDPVASRMSKGQIMIVPRISDAR